MEDTQINEAIMKMIDLCDVKMAGYVAVSARSALHELGYNPDEQDAVIMKIAERGFTYCLDPKVEATHFDPNNPRAVNDMVTDRPGVDACYWGPDQLKSRLWGVTH